MLDVVVRQFAIRIAQQFTAVCQVILTPDRSPCNWTIFNFMGFPVSMVLSNELLQVGYCCARCWYLAE